VLGNDLCKGVCPAGRVVCLILDECHRATGNAPAVTAIRELAKAPGGALRIIGLSATPGSQPDKVQEVITNTRASRICFYADDDPEIVPHRHERSANVIVVQAADDLAECLASINSIQYGLLCKLVHHRVWDNTVPERASAYNLNQAKICFGSEPNPAAKCRCGKCCPPTGASFWLCNERTATAS
jgi:ERCC4-related helicase